MIVVFLFPGSNPYEALDNWVKTIGRQTRHDVLLARRPSECVVGDCAFVLTEANSYPKAKVEADMAELEGLGVKYGVIHNNDTPGKAHGKEISGIPTPGDYPSFCWTKRGQDRLKDHRAIMLRQPVLPPIVPPFSGENVLVGTFGHIEPKKQTFEMSRWARKHGVPFVAFGPDVLAETYDFYHKDLRSFGCDIILHPWLHEIEQLAPFVANCSHFMFALPDSKKGTGGSPTSPRFAGLFNRPVIVIDDESTFCDDGYYVFSTLSDILPFDLAMMRPPLRDWSPDAYLEALIANTFAYWRYR